MCKEATQKDEHCVCGELEMKQTRTIFCGVSTKPLCPDCTYCSEEEQYHGYIKHNQYFCNFKNVMVCAKKQCTFHTNKYLKERREKEAPTKTIDTEALIKLLTDHMLCNAMDTVSGTITLHTAYSHTTDIKIYLGPPPKHRREHVCEHCLNQGPLMGDTVDLDKQYCEKCCRHTWPGYNDEV